MIDEVEVLWITAGLGCDGESVAITAASQPSIEDLVLGAIPSVPRMILRNPLLATENGDEFLDYFHRAAEGQTEAPFILVVEGSIPNEKIKAEGCWAGFGCSRETGQPIPTCDWIDRLAPRAWAVVAIGTCATYGGIHAMEGNPTGCMGLPDYLGWKWKSPAGVPIVCIPGCPTQPDNMTQTFLYLLNQVAGRAPMIPLDDCLRPKWLFEATLHEGCDRGGYYEQGDFASRYGEPQCIVKLGCWGPVIQCNVGKRGWMGGVGGCPNVGGVCIGCTMPGFPDRFMPFLSQPPGSLLSAHAITNYGRAIRALRRFTQASFNKEPQWRHPGSILTTGYEAPEAAGETMGPGTSTP
jgi:hydrogenase small subunit